MLFMQRGHSATRFWTTRMGMHDRGIEYTGQGMFS